MKKFLNIAIICGGPALERGISLNSARSLLDHLLCDDIEVHPIYVDHFENFYEISKFQLYSNTPSDFDFKLGQMSTKLTQAQLIKKLKTLDIVFPAIHGSFGEDGQLQTLLEENNIPFVGCGSDACGKMFFKNKAANVLEDSGYPVLPTEVLKMGDSSNQDKVFSFFEKHQLKRAIVKPIAGGSSLGVFSAYTKEEAVSKLQKLFDMKIEKSAILEPFCYGKEFTIIVIQNPNGEPVALVPSEIVVSYDNGQIFDYRRKYLPTGNTAWLCPPSFSDEDIHSIQKQAEQLFKTFGMRDFARLDGWILNNGKILFTDFNPISGMEQNSFIFQQSSRVGMTHRDLLLYLVKNALNRYGIQCNLLDRKTHTKEKVNVLFGGATAERQVSLMSGTNIWLKLKQSKQYDPQPFFLDKDYNVWLLPYTFTLSHTVEEIYENCLNGPSIIERLKKNINVIRQKLKLDKSYIQKAPLKVALSEFLETYKDRFLFLGLHGGFGEDGQLQAQCEEKGIEFNGSGSKASRICMNKAETGIRVNSLQDPFIISLPKQQICFNHKINFKEFWQKIESKLEAPSFVIKPNHDGCSSGIVKLYGYEDLEKYSQFVFNKSICIPANTFKNQDNIIEMNHDVGAEYILEPYIETDTLSIEKGKLKYNQNKGWLELTVGVLEQNGKYHALNPSITVAEGAILSVEEKFQGGTGVNITPPPESLVSSKQLLKIKESVERVAEVLEVENYARIDIFFNVLTEVLIIIEANTLPALTPSTVIYHQGIAEVPSLSPMTFLEKIIELKRRSNKSKTVAA